MRKVIYTCLTGKYDEFRSPLAVRNDWDYICFSNNSHLPQNKIWEIRTIPYQSKDNILLSRFAKIQPHKVLADYRYSLYIDANIQIIDDGFYDVLENLIASGTELAHVKHPFRDCVYDDIISCYLGCQEDLYKVHKSWTFLKKNGYPFHNGLYENNIIFREHNIPQIIQANELWWNLFCSLSRRDQFTLCFVYWKLNIRPQFLFNDGKCARNSQFLKYYPHPLKILTKWMTIRDKVKHKMRNLNTAIFHQYIFPTN